MSVKVGIVGGSGYAGGELIRLLLQHPRMEVVWATSRADKDFETVHPNLMGSGMQFTREEEAGDCDVVFFCMPARESMTRAPRYLGRGVKVVDVGSDFRLKNESVFEQVYGGEHGCWDLVEESPYGATELHREEIARARLVANPGCFAYTMILSLAPLVKAGWIELDRIVVAGLTGTSGAGAEPKLASQHSEMANSAFPYNVVDHRHTYEVEQELARLAGADVGIHFTPIFCPFTRGILASCQGFATRQVNRDEVLELYADFYAAEPFVDVISVAKDPSLSWQYLPYPNVGHLMGSNYVQIGVDVDLQRGRIVAVGALDNLGKGAASSAIQNMNCMLGFPEEEGLRGRGLHP